MIAVWMLSTMLGEVPPPTTNRQSGARAESARSPVRSRPQHVVSSCAVAELDRREPAGLLGLRSPRSSFVKCALGHHRGALHVRVGRAYASFRRISAALRRGRLSYSNLLALTRLPTRPRGRARRGSALNRRRPRSSTDHPKLRRQRLNSSEGECAAREAAA